MGDHQHLTLHKQGRKAWNVWRKAHPEIQPLFSGTDLSGTFVGRRDLSHANLRMSMLNGISLVRTDLRYADLSRAHPGDTTLSETDLSGAKFSEANLIGAVLDTVVPTRAIFTDATLSGALLNGADSSEIILNGVLRSRADHTDTGDEHGQETV